MEGTVICASRAEGLVARAGSAPQGGGVGTGRHGARQRRRRPAHWPWRGSWRGDGLGGLAGGLGGRLCGRLGLGAGCGLLGGGLGRLGGRRLGRRLLRRRLGRGLGGRLGAAPWPPAWPRSSWRPAWQPWRRPWPAWRPAWPWPLVLARPWVGASLPVSSRQRRRRGHARATADLPCSGDAIAFMNASYTLIVGLAALTVGVFTPASGALTCQRGRPSVAESRQSSGTPGSSQKVR